MKKLLTIAAFAAFTTVVSASSLTWGWSTTSFFVAKPGDTEAISAAEFGTDDIPSGAALVLVYLGQSSAFDISAITDEKVVETIAYTGFSGDESESFWKEESQTKTLAITAANGYSANDWFGIAFYDGSSYSAIKDITDFDNGTLGGDLTPTVQITDLDPTKSFSLNPYTHSTDGAAAVVVPEPSVAILGLLGLGMLLKRRRA